MRLLCLSLFLVFFKITLTYNNTNDSSLIGSVPDGGLPEAGVEQSLGVRVHVGDPGKEDEGHLSYPQPVQLRRH